MRAVIWLILLIGIAQAVSDCELCSTISAVYGVCSPELLLNYANKTGIIDIEWKCLNPDITIPEPEIPFSVAPIHTVSRMNWTIGIYSNEKNAFIYPSRNLIAWGHSLDAENDYNLWLLFNISNKSSIEIQSFGLLRNNSKFGNQTFFIELENSSLISSIQQKSSGWAVNLSLASKSGAYNVSIKIGKLDACIVACGSFTDGIYITTYSSGTTGILIGNFFTYMATQWRDYERTCTVAGCNLCPQTNAPSGTWAQIPITDNSKPLDTNGVSTNNCKLSPTQGTPYYLYPQCNLVSSGRYVRAQMSVWVGASHPFSCVSANTAPGIYLTAPANNSNLTNPPPVNFTFYYVDAQNSTANCSLWINGTRWLTNSSTLNNTNTTFQVSFNYSATNMSWWVNCSDGLLSNVSATRYFSVHPTGTGWGLGLSLIPLILIILASRMKELVLQYILIASAIMVIIAGLGLSYSSGYLDPQTAMILQFPFILLLIGLSAWFIGPIIYQGIKNYVKR